MLSDTYCGKKSFVIPGPAGVLEAVLDCPQPVLREELALLCHPHSLHGGSLNNKVVHYLARTFNDLGMPALRFNFRGVGASEGVYAQGLGETQDLLAVVDWLRQQGGGPIVLGGFSFGAYVALRAAAEVSVRGLLSVAPPVNIFDFSRLEHPGRPWLVIQGDADEIVPVAGVDTWVESLAPAPAYRRMAGAGHFFHGRLNDLRAMVKLAALESNICDAVKLES